MVQAEETVMGERGVRGSKGRNGDMSIVCEWLKKAVRDLKASELLLQEGLYEESTFHSQQAVEKALKALLLAVGILPPRTHSIERLLNMLEEKVDVSWAYEMHLPALTYYAIEVRYPSPPVSGEEAMDMLDIAKRAVEKIRSILPC